MHHLYETNAYVLRVIPQGEADALILLCTERFGLLRAVAQGLRYEKSKLRFAIQEYARVQVTLVRGKGVWRLTNAQTDTLFASTMTPQALRAFARIAKLLERLLAGEESDPHLFLLCDSGCTALAACIKDTHIEAIELLFVLRVLHQLGYVGESKTHDTYVVGTDWGTVLLDAVLSDRILIAQIINHGIRESQL